MAHSGLLAIEQKMIQLNGQHQAVIFVLTGANGTGKTVMSKRLLTSLPFHQTFNLGAVTKTIRYIYQDAETTRLENFTDEKITKLFTPIVQFACNEYQKNGVNVIVDGIQIDPSSLLWSHNITGGVVLKVNSKIKNRRNHYPVTHFNRAMDLHVSDNYTYRSSDKFVNLDTKGQIDDTFDKILQVLSDQLDKQLSASKKNLVASVFE